MAPPSLLSTAIVALCVQAIWMTRAHSISSRGLAPSMNALRHLVDRGLTGVRLIISDACRGLMESAAEYLPEARWQTTATDELRELRDDELDSVSGGLVVIAILAILIGLPPAPPLTPFPHNPP